METHAPVPRATVGPTGPWYAVLDDARVAAASGPDARSWLHDLLTCDVASLAPGTFRHGLFLTPTGRIRAEVSVGVRAAGTETFVMIQGGYGRSIVDLLLPYVLSADVALEERTGDVVIAVDAALATGVDGADVWRPSSTGLADASDLLVAAGDLDDAAGRLAGAGALRLDRHEREARRILAGVARFGVDADEQTLPAEVGWDDAIDGEKGCFPGQEAIAKVRNLGHPPSVVLHLAAPRALTPGEPVSTSAVDGDDVVVAGHITSAAVLPDGSGIALGRIRWDARELPLVLSDGAPLTPIRRTN